MTPPSRQRGMSVWPTVLRTAEILPAALELLRHVLVGVDDDRALVEPQRALLQGLRRGREPEARTTRGRARARGPARRRSFSCAGGYNSAMRTPPRFQPLDFERLAETEMTPPLRRVSRAHRGPGAPSATSRRARASLADRERRARRVARAVGGQPPALAIRRRLRPGGQDGRSASPRKPRRRRATNAACPRSGSKLSPLWARTGTSRFSRSAPFLIAVFRMDWEPVPPSGGVDDGTVPSRERTTTSPSPSGSPAVSCSRLSTSRASRRSRTRPRRWVFSTASSAGPRTRSRTC